MKAVVSDSLQHVLKRRLYQKNDVIFNEGDLPSYAYIIRSGSVHIAKQNGPTVTLLTTLVENQIFGELALIEDNPRSATAIAAETTEVLLITREQFKAKMEQMDRFMKYLVGYLTDRIYDLSTRVDD
jgi:CRP-like cAMP-binding protein